MPLTYKRLIVTEHGTLFAMQNRRQRHVDGCGKRTEGWEKSEVQQYEVCASLLEGDFGGRLSPDIKANYYLSLLGTPPTEQQTPSSAPQGRKHVRLLHFIQARGM